jgi:acyl-CoA hydrolase
MVQGNLQQYLGDLIEVNAVQVEAIESALHVRVDYVVRRTQQRQTVSVQAGVR